MADKTVFPLTALQGERWAGAQVERPMITVEMGRICYTKADFSTIKYELKKDIRVGRGPESDIRIKQNTVSRTHCNIYRRWADDGSYAGDYYLQNVSTTNLTEINYVTTWGVSVLRDGDVITIGDRDFVFRLSDVEMTPEELASLRAPTAADDDEDDDAPSRSSSPDAAEPPESTGPPRRAHATPVQEPGWCLTPQDDYKAAPRPRLAKDVLPPTAAAKPAETMWDCLPNLVPIGQTSSNISVATTNSDSSSSSSSNSNSSSSSSSSSSSRGSRSRSSSSSGGDGTTNSTSITTANTATNSSISPEVEAGGPTPLRAQRKKRTAFTPETLQREREQNRRLKAEAAQKAASESIEARAPDPDQREKQSPDAWLAGWFFTL